MNRLHSFDEQALPAVLLSQGWKSVGGMKYQLESMEIWFDSSHAFSVYSKGQRVADHFAKNVDEFRAILESMVTPRVRA